MHLSMFSPRGVGAGGGEGGGGGLHDYPREIDNFEKIGV